MSSGGLVTEQQSPVLVVEDDEAIRLALCELLTDEGYVVESARTGRQAIEKLTLNSQHPCIVLLDLVMPDIDGSGVLRFLQETDRLYTIPVVVMTAVRKFPPLPGEVRS